MKLGKVTIPSNGITLAGLTYLPDADAGRTPVVLAHGYTASKESMDLLAAYLASRGYPCLTFDCRGHKLGSTGGELADLSVAVSDVRMAARWMMQESGQPRCVLAGHSMGGILSIAAAVEMPEVSAVCAIAIGPNPAQGFRTPAGQAMLALRSDYVVGMEPIRVLEGLAELVQNVDRLREKPSLFVAARADILVKAEKLRELSERAGALASFAEVDGSHLEAPDRARGVVTNWLDKVSDVGLGA